MEEKSFLRDAIEKIEKMAYPHLLTVAGIPYYDSGSNITQIRPPLDETPAIELRSLDALVSMVKNESKFADDREYCSYYVSVQSPTEVAVYSTPRSSLRNARHTLCIATAGDIPGFKDTTYNYEQAIIALRSRFAPSEDQKYVIDLMGHLCSEQSVTTEDDGITQRVAVNSGIAMLKQTTIKPIVQLRPYRTFQEVQQPESEFLIRLDNDRNLNITQADGGMWKLAARRIVKEWLIDAFADEILSGAVIVML